MKVLCKASNMASDVRCSICGQGFLVYWAGNSAVQRAQQHAEVLQVLRRHHEERDATGAHPRGEFFLPGWEADSEAMLKEPLDIAA